MSGVADSKNNGLIDVEVDWGSSAVISDVIVDGATACNTLQWNGIRIMCAGAMAFPGNQPVIIRALPRILNSSTILLTILPIVIGCIPMNRPGRRDWLRETTTRHSRLLFET